MPQERWIQIQIRREDKKQKSNKGANTHKIKDAFHKIWINWALEAISKFDPRYFPSKFHRFIFLQFSLILLIPKEDEIDIQQDRPTDPFQGDWYAPR